MNQQLEDDLHDHFVERLHQLLLDTTDTCRIAGLGPGSVIKLLIAGLMGELMRAVFVLDLSEKEFIDMCRVAYRHTTRARARARH